MSDEEISALIAQVEEQLGESWAEAVSSIRDDNTLNQIEARIRDHDIDGAIQGISNAAKKFADDVNAGYVTSGEAAAKWISKRVDTEFKFDEENKRAAKWAKNNAAELVTGFEDEQKALARSVIEDGIKAGTNPRVIARDLRDFIGLTDTQKGYIESYRAALDGGDYSNALGRELSDGRSDKTIRAAQSAGRALTEEEKDLAVERYQKGWIAYRAETIAHHEAVGAVHQGSREGFQQAIDAGHVEAKQLEREWHHTRHGKFPRVSHEAMNGQKRGFDEPFETGDGVKLMMPHDPDAPLEEVLGCACGVSTRLAV